MTSSWRVRSIDDVCEQVTSGGTPSRRRPEFYENGDFGWVKTKELFDKWINDTEEYITSEAIKKSSAKLLPRNTVLLTMYGATVGQLGILGTEMTCNQACCALIVDSDQADFRFLFYQLLSNRQVIRSLSTGAAQQNLSASQIKQFEFGFPEIDEQRYIAQILGGFDDKIDINRQINQTLEQIAQAIFKSWFVDFEPVKAKQHVRAIGGNDEQTERAARAVIAGAVNLDVIATATDLSALDQQLIQALSEKHAYQTDAQREQLATSASHFPDQLVESELGLIPEGWEIRSLDKIADFLNGVAAQKFPAQDGQPNLPVIKIAEMRGGLSAKTGRASRGVDTKYIISNGDLLFSWSGSLLVRQWSLGEGLLNQHIFKVTSVEFPKWFYHQWICFHLKQFQQIAADKAVTMGHIKRSHLSEAKTLVPNKRLISIGTDVLGTMFEQELQGSLEKARLAGLRDLMLPKLLSGELDVSGACRNAAEVP
ncbi:MAG: restriction endonuclease subunit S [Proteobacteria bacterium]|nr:restriction endonuclease subunit S [Pseudomonadota bacterium]